MSMQSVPQSQSLLRAHLAAATKPLSFPNLNQAPLLSSAVSSVVQGMPQIDNTQVEIYLNQLRLHKAAEKPEPVVEQAQSILGATLSQKMVTKDSTPKEIAEPIVTVETEIEQRDEENEENEAGSVDKVQSGKKIKKHQMICGHPERKHYAKGYCSECYHKKCRMQKPKLCGHDNLYARELCQRCYAEKYKKPKKGKKSVRKGSYADQDFKC
eukprot:CAMPEP_0176431926 /NCGR_PEP_ID=MMETSP0127-20121128/15085_1 /TAXON_ID=938130 /ORGANISM="Platyophrya macrostoma, Strain WH" /LENGTH=211 /DNA_ID=CAMNT_0017813991 /DNA_START=387 /DNA_END=1022 /DNA_ORIENTATION=-